MLEGFGETLSDLKKDENRSLRTKRPLEWPFLYLEEQNLPIK
jgi:hypothetical protein